MLSITTKIQTMPFHGTKIILKLKSSLATYPTSNAKSLACDTAMEHALTCTRETCSCSHTNNNKVNYNNNNKE